MSGPKTSRYLLTDEQLEKIKEQQRIILETKIAKDKKENLYNKCLKQVSDLKLIIVKFQQLYDESGYGKEQLDILNENKKEIVTSLKSITSTENLKTMQTESKKLEILLDKIKEINLKAKNSIKELSSNYEKELGEIIANGFKLSFSNLKVKKRDKENQFIIKINNAFEQIGNIELSMKLKEELMILQKRASEIYSVDFLENFYSIQVLPFIYKCNYYKEHIDEYKELLLKYKYLILEVGDIEENFVFSEENIIKLRLEINRLYDLMIHQKEDEYISNSIDEAMIEMGYNLIGERSVLKKNGKKFRNNLYMIEGETAVNVTFSNFGQISMELGDLDKVDRLPTEYEAIDLVEDMKDFCINYNILERKLAERGIMTKKISALPPLTEYAQIFNISDYKLKNPIKICKDKNQKITLKKHKYEEG